MIIVDIDISNTIVITIDANNIKVILVIFITLEIHIILKF